MAAILIRNLDEETKGRLRVRAAMHRRSLEAEVREILRCSVKDLPGFSPEAPPSVEPDRDLPLPAEAAKTPVPYRRAPPPMDVVIEEVNRQLEKLGMSEFALSREMLP